MIKSEKEELLGGGRRGLGETGGAGEMEGWEQRMKSREGGDRRSTEREEFRTSLGRDWRRESTGGSGRKYPFESTFGREDKLEELEKKKRESESFQRNLDHLSSSSKNLRDKIKGLQQGEQSFGGPSGPH